LRLLLAEDDAELATRLKRFLDREGYAVDHFDNGVDAEFYGSETPYDTIVLDLGLPQRPGLEVLCNWRRAGLKTPVLILTARDTWQEKVEGLQAGWVLDQETQSVSRGQQRWQLTGTEFRLLRYFMLYPGHILSKSRLTEHVYEQDADKDSNVIEVYVNRLRQKLGSDVIRTRRGQGYVFGDGA
jgi:two-component system OmpR family response regulator